MMGFWNRWTPAVQSLHICSALPGCCRVYGKCWRLTSSSLLLFAGLPPTQSPLLFVNNDRCLLGLPHKRFSVTLMCGAIWPVLHRASRWKLAQCAAVLQKKKKVNESKPRPGEKSISSTATEPDLAFI